MRKIYAKAIEMADAKVLKENLIALVGKINESNYAERFIDVLFDADLKENEIPYMVENYNEIRTRKSFDYLNDRIDYDYTKLNTRYFANEADAIEYAKSGKYNYNNSKASRDDEYTYEAKYTIHSDSYCSFYEWMNSKVIEK